MRSFLITGDLDKREHFIASFIKNEKIPPHSITIISEELKIKEAKALRLTLSKKYSEKKLVIISSGINIASQNALLKSFEELQENICVILSLPSANEILSTVRSRLFHIPFSTDLKKMDSEVNLISSKRSEKLLIIDEFIFNNKDIDSKYLVDKFLSIYRNGFIENIHTFNKNELRIHLEILKKLFKTSILVKYNNLNLRLGLENALL